LIEGIVVGVLRRSVPVAPAGAVGRAS
jgi:hypothetical protein